jgi:hypothetical protein
MEQELHAPLSHMDGHNHNTTDEGHVFDKAVGHEHGLKEQRIACCEHGIALFVGRERLADCGIEGGYGFTAVRESELG